MQRTSCTSGGENGSSPNRCDDVEYETLEEVGNERMKWNKFRTWKVKFLGSQMRWNPFTERL